MVTTRERPERLRGAIASGTAGRWTEEVVWVEDKGNVSIQPMVLVADEPTTPLDVTIQAQYLRLLKELLQESRLPKASLATSVWPPPAPSGTWISLNDPQEVLVAPHGGGYNSGALTQVRQEPRGWVKHSYLMQAAATAVLEIPPVSMLGIFGRIDSILKQYFSARSTESHSVYHAPAQPEAGRAEPLVYGVGEEERPVVLIEAPILRQYLVSVAGPTKAEYRPGYRFLGDSR